MRGGLLPPGRRRRGWMLLLALLLAAGTGAVYLWKWNSGLRGPDLLGFVAVYLTFPLCMTILFLFAYLKQPSR